MKIQMKFYNELCDEFISIRFVNPSEIKRPHVDNKIDRTSFGLCEKYYQIAIKNQFGVYGSLYGSGQVSYNFNYIAIKDMVDIFKTFGKTKYITKYSADSHYIRQCVEHPRRFKRYVGHGDIQLAAILSGFRLKHLENGERILSFNMRKKDVSNYFQKISKLNKSERSGFPT